MYARAYKSQIIHYQCAALKILVDDKSIHLLWHKNKEATCIYLDIFPTVHIVIHRKTSWFGHKAFMIRASIKSSTLTFKHSTCCSSNRQSVLLTRLLYSLLQTNLSAIQALNSYKALLTQILSVFFLYWTLLGEHNSCILRFVMLKAKSH